MIVSLVRFCLSETDHMNDPFVRQSPQTRSMCLHISALRERHAVPFYLSIPPLPTETLQPLSPSILCYSQAAIYNIQMISQ